MHLVLQQRGLARNFEHVPNRLPGCVPVDEGLPEPPETHPRSTGAKPQAVHSDRRKISRKIRRFRAPCLVTKQPGVCYRGRNPDRIPPSLRPASRQGAGEAYDSTENARGLRSFFAPACFFPRQNDEIVGYLRAADGHPPNRQGNLGANSPRPGSTSHWQTGGGRRGHDPGDRCRNPEANSPSLRFASGYQPGSRPGPSRKRSSPRPRSASCCRTGGANRAAIQRVGGKFAKSTTRVSSPDGWGPVGTRRRSPVQESREGFAKATTQLSQPTQLWFRRRAPKSSNPSSHQTRTAKSCAFDFPRSDVAAPVAICGVGTRRPNPAIP